MGDTKIEWTEKVWNPVTGCTKVSQGCKNCYAERVFPRPYPGRAFTDVRTHHDRLEDPLHWRKPSRIFVNSMSDLFHESIPIKFIDKVFAIMAAAKQHTFQVLTKRPARMLEYLSPSIGNTPGSRRAGEIGLALDGLLGLARSHQAWGGSPWPLPNVWMGISCEDQKTADERIPLLLQVPAAVRWISAEPLLGPILLRRLPYLHGKVIDPLSRITWVAGNAGTGERAYTGLDWVVVGGESGPRARPMHGDWARGLRDQCVSANIPFFFKQWGEWKCETVLGVDVEMSSLASNQAVAFGDGKTNHTLYTRVGKHAAGSLLDGKEWKEYPKEADALTGRDPQPAVIEATEI